METKKRRKEIINILSNSSTPLTGKELARHFRVSRQVIVQDIAILRASGEPIIATLQGYIIPEEQKGASCRSVVACRHNREQIEEEIGIIVDLGGKVIDVIVGHPVYGELKGSLMIASRRDLNAFLEMLTKTRSSPLSLLTGGVHLHTLEAPDQKIMEEIIEELKRAGFLIE